MNAPATDRPKSSRPWWRWLKRGFTLLFFVLLVVLLASLARNVDWPEVADTLRGYSLPLLLAGVGISAASYLMFCSYDLLGKRYTQHTLPTRRVLLVAFVCYAFNLNLGAWVPGWAAWPCATGSIPAWGLAWRP